MVKRVQFSNDGTKLMGAGSRKHGREGGVSRGYFFQRRITLKIGGNKEEFNVGSLIDFLNTKLPDDQQLTKDKRRFLFFGKFTPGSDDKKIREAFETAFSLAKQNDNNPKTENVAARKPHPTQAEGEADVEEKETLLLEKCLKDLQQGTCTEVQAIVAWPAKSFNNHKTNARFITLVDAYRKFNAESQRKAEELADILTGVGSLEAKTQALEARRGKLEKDFLVQLIREGKDDQLPLIQLLLSKYVKLLEEDINACLVAALEKQEDAILTALIQSSLFKQWLFPKDTMPIASCARIVKLVLGTYSSQYIVQKSAEGDYKITFYFKDDTALQAFKAKPVISQEEGLVENLCYGLSHMGSFHFLLFFGKPEDFNAVMEHLQQESLKAQEDALQFTTLPVPLQGIIVDFLKPENR
jgi:hypothetical protein